jgi:DNA-binding HxlR family transcriptional regulator
MFLIAPFHIRQETMKTIQQPKTMTPISIGRWTPKILFALKEKPYRHGELRRRLGGVSQRMLTRTLRSLESTGLIAKRATRSNAVAVVEYSLTHLGSTIIGPLRGMCRWAERYRMDVRADVLLKEV